MPTYRFFNNETGDEYEERMSISALDEYLIANPKVTQLVNGAPLIHSGRGLKKPEDGFRDLLKTIKKGNTTYSTDAAVNTF